MTLPTFFIIGAGKAGTTSLHYYLDLHPEIQMSAVKETHFFAGPANGRPYALGQVETLKEYEKLFASEVRMRGEASPSYTLHPIREGAPGRIKELVPDAKFIYLVRDPIARTVSHYQHRVASGGERRSLRGVLGDCSEPSRERETCMSLYASQLDQYLSHFPQERILVVDQAELLGDRRSTLRQVFSFLSVDETFTSAEFDAELLKGSEGRSYPPGYNRFIRRVVGPPMRRVPPRFRRSFRRAVETRLFSPAQKASLDDDLRARLEELYGDEVERLRALTGKSFATWSI
jgi:hypothetical protein